MSRPPATHCKRNHPLSGDNLYVIPSRPGSRLCRTCRTEWRRPPRPADDMLHDARVTIASLRAELAAARQQLRAQRHVIADLQRDITHLRRPRPITHRRIADGGIGGKRERQQLRRAA